MADVTRSGIKGPALREQLAAVTSEAAWIILLSCALFVLLYLPGQIRELYRIELLEAGGRGPLILLPVLLISAAVWLGARLVTADAVARLSQAAARPTRVFADALPVVLAVLPLLGLALGVLNALPLLAGGLKLLGASLVENAADPAPTDYRLEAITAAAAAVIAAVLALPAVFAYRLSRRYGATMAEIGARHFGTWWSLAISVALIAAITAVLLAYPVTAAQRLGVFGILALFSVCVLIMLTHLSLMARAWRLPLVSSLLGLAVVFSWFDLNDNHGVRVLAKTSGAPQSAPRGDEEFLTWYERRPDFKLYPDEYPVYIVTAQGGGIKAAYQTAIFLARMQDLCLAFTDHLFAVSAVSGGSLGAAVFTAALRAVEAEQKIPAGQREVPIECLSLQKFEGGGAPLDHAEADEPGLHELAVRRMLQADLLSPLVGAALFTDFSQRFLPVPIGAFDRARALEAGFEAATSPKGVPETGPLAANFLDHWRPKENLGPALLLNSTDAATGQRVLIAPFAIERNEARGKRALTHFPLWKVQPDGFEIRDPLEISLSTAAGVSARFPWLTPAATVKVMDAKSGATITRRLVDGGYVDNSGIETALDLLRVLEPMAEKISYATSFAARDPTGPQLRPVKFHIISLSGSESPVRTSYALGETMEPLRALLSTWGSRADVAEERARLASPPEPIAVRDTGERLLPITLSKFQVTRLQNDLFPLPLGWALGDLSRQTIEDLSGQYWRCRFNERFEQADSSSGADCVQMLVIRQLTRKMDAAVDDVAAGGKSRDDRDIAQAVGKRLDNKVLLACYDNNRGTPFSLLQQRTFLGLMNIWDAHLEWTDDNILAFILGSVAYETKDFQPQGENLNYASAERIMAVWPGVFGSAEDAARYIGNPEGLANRVYALRRGNTQKDDGWRFRGRGVTGLVGRGNYKSFGRLVGADLEALPDLLLDPETDARVAFAQVMPLGSLNRLAPFIKDDRVDWPAALQRISFVTSGDRQTGRIRKIEAFVECIAKAKRP